MVHDRVSGCYCCFCCVDELISSSAQAYDGRRSSYLNDSLDSLTQHDEQRPLCTPAEEGNARMATFYERVSLRRAQVLNTPTNPRRYRCRRPTSL